MGDALPPSQIDEPAEAMTYWFHTFSGALRAAGLDRVDETGALAQAEMRGLAMLLVSKGLVAPADWQRSMADSFEHEHSDFINHRGRYGPDGGTVPTAERGDDDHGN